MAKTLENKTILLVITGGIAAYKALELTRLLRKNGARVRSILTQGGAQFITPLSVSSLTGEETCTDLWSLKDETEMGHIRLSRESDLIIVAPASADMIAKMAHGLSNDLASATLLAADKQILIAPAMNHMMWNNQATQDNITALRERGIKQIGPAEGDMACGEFGMGRMAEPEEILNAVFDFFFERPLKNLKALITSGPTFEPVDPVRFIGNRSSGKQGHAIAAALAREGAEVTLVSGPTALPTPPGVKVIAAETAEEMLKACQKTLPADIAVCAAAVSDWRAAEPQNHKIKKRANKTPPTLILAENPDILKTIATGKNRPKLVIGFAAETENLLAHAREKLAAKGCDWILANDVSDGKTFNDNENQITLITRTHHEEWPRTSKSEIARKLAARITEHFKSDTPRLKKKHG